jgi:predicted GIY-YIG superfamily endonuclease
MIKTNIYILSLIGGRYYVGKSNNVIERYQQHIDGDGSSWTKLYKPISIIKVIENASPFEEDKITKEYMSKYGIDKVRGGSYVGVELDDFQLETLQMEIWAANDLCTQCGRAGHFVKDCYAKTDVLGNEIIYEELSDDESIDEWQCEYCNKTFKTEIHCENHENICKQKYSKKRIVCYRCGRDSHYSSDCYASKHIKGYYLD